MPVKIKRIFEANYGKKKGDRIFYSWQNKHRVMGVNLKKSVPFKGKPMKKFSIFERRK